MKKVVQLLIITLFFQGVALSAAADTPVVNTVKGSEVVTLTGNAGSAYGGAYITLLITKTAHAGSPITENDIIHIDQVVADCDGKYTFRFGWKTEYGNIEECSFNVSAAAKDVTPTIETVTSLTELFDSDVKLTLNAETNTVSVSVSMDNIYLQPGHKCTVIAAAYTQDGMLADIRMAKYDEIPLSGLNETVSFASILASAKRIKAYLVKDLTNMAPYLNEAPPEVGRPLKVLAIGNSFSVDAMEWLYKIAKNAGLEEVVLGNLYIGGCSLATHWENAQSGSSSYSYFKNSTGSWANTGSRSLLYGLLNEDWDYITLQQASRQSGLAETYEPPLSDLSAYIKTHCPNARLIWHMTWAYQQDSTHAGFANYGQDQIVMYNSIVDAAQTKVMLNGDFDFIIPAGTAIQNLRTSYIGDTITRDGHHLSNIIGRYTAGMTWFKTLTGMSIDHITYVPYAPNDTPITPEKLQIIKEAVNAAVKDPCLITQSSYTQP